ncbi:YcxB family protein [Alkalihalobacterium bogoriense]|uniref:YcxB family protein n=1 Tax=Alkalihalobacterium bogoriense TaxID=246272 RepID=UPI00047966C6|nr:YcxB family protein [Alkalihalobacterium bogoriense]
MDIKYMVTPEDSKAFLMEVKSHVAMIKFFKYFCGFVLSPAILFFLYYNYYWHPAIPLSIIVGYGLLFVFLWVFLFISLLIELSDLFYIKRQLNRNQSYFYKDMIMKVSSDGITFNLTTPSTHLTWDKFHRVIENKTHFFFISKKKTAGHVLRKDQLDSEAKQFLQSTLRNHAPSFVQKDTPPKLSIIPLKVKAILFVSFFILSGYVNIQSYDSYEKIKYDTYQLWENVELDETPVEVRYGERKLILKDSVTMEDVQHILYRLKFEVKWTDENTYDLSNLAVILRHAEDQLNARPREEASRMFSGESENWKVENYEVIFWWNYYNEMVEGTLIYKPEGVLETKFFQVTVIGVFNERLEVQFHEYSVGTQRFTEEIYEIKETTTGGRVTKDSGYDNARRERATIDDLTTVHILIQWLNENEELEEEVVVLSPVND